MKNFIIAALCALCLIGWLRTCGRHTEKITTKTDTIINVVYRDAVKPKLVIDLPDVRVNVPKVMFDTTANTEIVYINDTTYIEVAVPMSEYQFKEESLYDVRFKAYRAHDFSIKLYDKAVTNTTMITSRPKRWGIGIQTGYGITLDGRPQPYIGVGLSYNLIRF